MAAPDGGDGEALRVASIAARAACLLLVLLASACGDYDPVPVTPPPPAGSGANSVAQVKADALGSHEALPPGLGAAGPAPGTRLAPTDAVAYGGYGEAYLAADDRAQNTRIHLRNFETFVLRKSTGAWTRVQYSERVDGAAYTMNYAAVAVATPTRNEAGGGISVKPAPSTVFRFWPESGLVSSIVPPADVAAIFNTVQARLVVDSAAAADDRGQARMVVRTASDWRRSLTLYATPVPAPADIAAGTAFGTGKLRLVGSEWQAINFHTASDAQVDALDKVQGQVIGARKPLANSEARDLPPARRVVVIGDSISEGRVAGPADAGQDSFRRPLWNGIVADPAQPLVDFVGTRTGVMTIGGNCLSGVPASGGLPLVPEFDQDHEAYSGWCLENVGAVLPDRLRILALEQDSIPDVALVHLGSSDIDQQTESVQTMSDQLQALVAALREANPAIRVLLAQLIPLSNGNASTAALVGSFNEAVAALASRLNTPASPITVVDQNSGFSAADLSDGMHPNDAGELKMANRWLQALKAAVE
jgi:acyl-CoA thioesterase-1